MVNFTYSDEEIEEMIALADRQPLKYQSRNQLITDIGYTGNEKHIPIKNEIGKTVKVKGVLVDVLRGSFIIVSKNGKEAITSNQYDNAAITLLVSLEQKNLRSYHNSDATGIYGFVFSKPIAIKIDRVKIVGIFHKYVFEVVP